MTTLPIIKAQGEFTVQGPSIVTRLPNGEFLVGQTVFFEWPTGQREECIVRRIDRGRLTLSRSKFDARYRRH
jgi:hypothetical protein